MQRISYLLILLEQAPLEGDQAFVGFVLGELRYAGEPYRHHVRPNARIAVRVVGPQNFDDQALCVAALLREWGPSATTGTVGTQRFSSRSGTGVTVESWSTFGW